MFTELPYEKYSLTLFPWVRNFTLIAKYWLVPGMESSVISQSQSNTLRALWKID